MITNTKKIIWLAVMTFALGGVLVSRYLDTTKPVKFRSADSTYIFEAADMIDNQHFVRW